MSAKQKSVSWMVQILREGYVVESDFSCVNIYWITFRIEDLEEDFFYRKCRISINLQLFWLYSWRELAVFQLIKFLELKLVTLTEVKMRLRWIKQVLLTYCTEKRFVSVSCTKASWIRPELNNCQVEIKRAKGWL